MYITKYRSKPFTPPISQLEAIKHITISNSSIIDFFAEIDNENDSIISDITFLNATKTTIVRTARSSLSSLNTDRYVKSRLSATVNPFI